MSTIQSNIIPLPLPANPTGVRRLVPEGTALQRGEHGVLRCTITGDRTYEGVTAVRLFPISYGDQFVSLRFTDEMDKEKEIGIIERLSDFPPETVKQVHESLDRHYHERVIRRIHKIKQRYGQLFFTVETDSGPVEFVMPWRHDRAEEYGAKGRVLLDSLNNRYLVPDLDALLPKEKQLLVSFIYW